MQTGGGEFGVEPPGTPQIGEGSTAGHGIEGGEDGEDEEEGDQAVQRAATRANLDESKNLCQNSSISVPNPSISDQNP